MEAKSYPEFPVFPSAKVRLFAGEKIWLGRLWSLMNLLELFRPPPLDPMLKIVSGVSIFKECSRAELEALKLHLHERHFLAGEIVFDEGEEGEGMYVVIRGKLQASRKGLLKKKTLGVIKSGECFGEMALLGAGPRMATVVAEEATTVLAMFRPELVSLADSRPRLGFKIAMGVALVLEARLRRLADGEAEEPSAT
jgi:CRP-like cAMP-binding protein